MSDKYVSRSKYEKAKQAVTAWVEKYEQTQQQHDKTISVLKDEITKLKGDVNRWKKLSEELPDSELVEELEAENKQHRREIRKLKKELHDTEDRYKDKIVSLEREKLLSDGKIQQLEEIRKDLKERYNELKQDYREASRWNRGMSRSEN